MNRYKKLLTNTGLVALGTFGSKLLVVLMVRFYTACLTTNEYGTADLIAQTAKLIIPVISLGITETVFRFALDSEYRNKEVFTAGFALIGAGCAFFAVIVPILYSIDFFTDYVWLIVAYIISSNLHCLVTQYIRTKEHFKFYALQGIVNTTLTILFNILFLLVFKWGINGYILSVILADFITFLLVFIYEKLWRDIIPLKQISRRTVKAMLKYSIPLIPTTVFWWITSVSDRYMVNYFSGGDINGLYTAAYKIPTLLVLICTIFIQAWNFSAVVEEDEKERSRFFGNVFDSYQGILFISGAGIITFTKVASKILFSKSYFDSWKFIPILTIATVFSCLVSFVGSVYTVRKKSMFSFLTAMAGAVINIILNFFLIPTADNLTQLSGWMSIFKHMPVAGWGAAGAAVATLASYFIVFIIRAINIRNYVAFDMHTFKLVLNTAALSVQTVLIMYGVNHWFIWDAIILLSVMALNATPLISGVKSVIAARSKEKNQTSIIN